MSKRNSFHVILSLILAIFLILSFSGCPLVDLLWTETYIFTNNTLYENIYIAPWYQTTSWFPFWLYAGETYTIEVPMSEHVYISYDTGNTNYICIQPDSTTFIFQSP